MALFKKKPKVVDVDGKKVELQPKPGFSLFKKKAPKVSEAAHYKSFSEIPAQPPEQPVRKPVMVQPQQAARQPAVQKQKISIFKKPAPKPAQQPAPTVQQLGQPAKPAAPPMRIKAPNRVKKLIESIGARRKGLEAALREQGIKESIYEFIQRMLIAASILGIVLGITTAVLLSAVGLSAVESIIFAILIGITIFWVSFNAFLSYPETKARLTSYNIERDILFAARDMIISLRSGMPLYNAIASVSTGYGDSSKEFAKIIEKVQLGVPLEDAIDETIAKTTSKTFRKIMLQAAVSVRAGADVVGALQSVIDQMTEERIIQLRRYGQTLNALAMFYMLFGIILPSMGIAVATVLTTFISVFTVNNTVLEVVLVFLVFLQIIFLNLVSKSRPIFAL